MSSSHSSFAKQRPAPRAASRVEEDVTDSFLAIVNPAAGHGRCGKLASGAIERLQARGVRVVVRETRAAGDATRMADNALHEGFRNFIAAGGDGTSFEVVNGLGSRLGEKNPAERVSLGFLPLGTGNSFLRDFGDGGLDGAIDALALKRKKAVDAVKLTHARGHLHYINLLSFGFVADVCAVTNRRFKVLGQAGYGLGVVATLAGLKARPLRMRVDGGATWEQDVVFVSINNSKFTGGNMMMAPYADTTDGQLDVIVCGQMSRATLLETFPKIFRGHHVHHHAVTASRAKSIELFEGGEIDLMIDGEVLREKPLRVDCIHDALDVWV